MEKDLEILNNTENLRFETKLGKELAIIDYRWNNGDMVFMHTFVPPEGQGKGIAAKMAKHALDFVKNNNLKAKLYCPYMIGYVERNPEYKKIIR